MSIIYGQPITFGGGGAPKIFGDGSDGVAIISADTQWLAETEDTGMIVKNFESLTIPEGVTVSAGNRNCGMIIRVKGDCTIAGTLMNKMSPKTILDSDGVDFSAYPASMLTGTAGDGGAGANGATSIDLSFTTTGGAGMVGRFYGGGWSGGGGGGRGYSGGGTSHGGSSANITTATNSVFVGGVGGSTNPAGTSTHSTDGQYGGGGGGGFPQMNGYYSGGGGSGAGGNGSNAQSTISNYACGGGGGAGNYGGGVIILLVGGKLTITGAIDCSGNNGGNGGNGAYNGGGGGGGGGGRIFICHKGDISNTGTLNVNGGTGGTGGNTGNAGGIGTTAVKTYDQYMEDDVA